MLLDDYRNCPGVSSYHMSCKEDRDHPDKIKFLYKFKKGECPESFGMNVAMMSGLSKKIVDRAKVKS
jgi:DNA mismatch repair protein MSH6